jgi:hypothetical protein
VLWKHLRMALQKDDDLERVLPPHVARQHIIDQVSSRSMNNTVTQTCTVPLLTDVV